MFSGEAILALVFVAPLGAAGHVVSASRHQRENSDRAYRVSFGPRADVERTWRHVRKVPNSELEARYFALLLQLQRLYARLCEPSELAVGETCEVILVNRHCPDLLGALPMRLRPRAVGRRWRCGWGSRRRRSHDLELHAPFRKLIGDRRLCGFGGRDVGIAAHSVAFAQFSNAPAIHGLGHPRIDLQRRVVARDRVIETVEPEIDEATTVDC